MTDTLCLSHLSNYMCHDNAIWNDGLNAGFRQNFLHLGNQLGALPVAAGLEALVLREDCRQLIHVELCLAHIPTSFGNLALDHRQELHPCKRLGFKITLFLCSRLPFLVLIAWLLLCLLNNLAPVLILGHWPIEQALGC